MSSIRQQIEDAAIAVLSNTLGVSVGGYLRKAGPYNGELSRSADALDDLRRALVGNTPAILVLAGAARYESKSMVRNRYVRAVDLELIVASSHMRDRPSRLRSDVVAASDPTADPGIYQITEDIFSLIAGGDFGLAGVSRALPISEDPLAEEDDLTVWRVLYRLPTDALQKPPSFGTAPINTYAIDGNLIDDDGETQLPAPFNPATEADGDL